MGSNGPSWGRRYIEQKTALDYWQRLQRDADAAAVAYWNVRLEQHGEAQPSPTLGTAINGGYRFLRVRCGGCMQRSCLPLANIQRPMDTPLWKLEASLVCKVCRMHKTFPPKAKLERVVREEWDIGWANP